MACAARHLFHRVPRAHPGAAQHTRREPGSRHPDVAGLQSGTPRADGPACGRAWCQAAAPETSRNISAGLVAQTHIGLGGTVDLYQVDVDDRFSQSATIAIPAGFANPNRFTSISYFTNDFNTRTRGVDVVVSYARALGGGRASATLAYNYNRTTVRSGTSAAIANDTQRRIFQERLPQHNATGTLGYDIGPVGMILRGRYYGPWTDVTGNATGELFQRFGGIALFDASLTYRMTPNISIRGGAENLFDTYPAEATNQANRGLIYSRNAPMIPMAAGTMSGSG